MTAPRVLVVYATKHGGTSWLAGILGESLIEAGLDCEVMPAAHAPDVTKYDAVVLGGALYMGRWHHDAKAFARHNADALRSRPLWLFSSGPLDDTATTSIPLPVDDVQILMDDLGVRGHATFGGVLLPETAGFLGRRMIARGMGGDHIDRAHVQAWARKIAEALGVQPSATAAD